MAEFITAFGLGILISILDMVNYMKKWNFFASIFQIVVGVSAIIAYTVIVDSGDSTSKWTITLLLAIAFVVIGVIGMIDFFRSN